MLRSVEEAGVGRVVYLYPHTKTAGQWCWKRKVAVVEDAKTYWPRVKVSLTHEGKEIISYPHKDDIRLRPPAATTKQEKKDGDMAGVTEPARVRVMPGKIKELVDGVEQIGLW